MLFLTHFFLNGPLGAGWESFLTGTVYLFDLLFLPRQARHHKRSKKVLRSSSNSELTLQEQYPLWTFPSSLVLLGTRKCLTTASLLPSLLQKHSQKCYSFFPCFCAGWENLSLQEQYPLWTFSSSHRGGTRKCLTTASILPSLRKNIVKNATHFFLVFVRDGRIELPISVWKTDVIPFN